MSDTNDYMKKPAEKSRTGRAQGALRRPFTFFLVIVAIIFAMSVFLKISEIEVQGNAKYSAEQVISASGIHTGDNLFFINRIGAGSRIVVKLPYIDSVRITRSLPNRVAIVVEESRAVACIDVGEETWSVSQTGKFLSAIDEKEASLIAKVRGMTVGTAEVGEIMSVSEADSAKLSYLLDILYQIQARGLVDKVQDIDMTDGNNPTFVYDGRFIVKLGKNDNTEYKFGKLLSAMSQMTVDDAGTMDLADSNKVNFSPN